MNRQNIKIMISGGAGQIAYSLIPLICSGKVFGKSVKLNIKLYDILPMKDKLEGVKMEIKDSCFPLVNSILTTIDAKGDKRYFNESNAGGAKTKGQKSINALDLDWVLKKTEHKFPALENHGRRYWSYGTTNKERVAVNILVSEFLKKSGKPMHIQEIIKAIEEVRGISTTFQLRPSRSNKDLVMIDRKLWGLRERDLEISEEEENTIIQKILDKFTSGLAYVFDYELSEIMLDVGLKQSVTLFQVSRLLYSYVSTNRDYSEYFWLKFSGRDVNKFLIIDINYQGDIPQI